MKAISTFAMFVAMVVVLSSWAVPVASPPQTFSMTVVGFSTGPASSAGTWTSTGAIADSGTFATTFIFSGNPAPGALGAVVHAESTLTTAGGTITLRHTSVQTLVSPIEINLNGPTQIVGGTGAYDGIKGQGTMDLSLDLTNGNLTATVNGIRTR
jgi:hypothetical protein